MAARRREALVASAADNGHSGREAGPSELPSAAAGRDLEPGAAAAAVSAAGPAGAWPAEAAAGDAGCRDDSDRSKDGGGNSGSGCGNDGNGSASDQSRPRTRQREQLAVLVAYRDRPQLLAIFLKHMRTHLEAAGTRGLCPACFWCGRSGELFQ